MMRRWRRRWDDRRWPARARFDAERHRAAFDQAFWLVRLYYAAMLFIAYEELPALWRTAVNGGRIEPLWPVFWATDVEQASTLLLVLLITAALLAVALPDRRFPKILLFASFFLTAAFRTSFALGSVNHGNHYWLWLAFCFCFLPSGSQAALRTSLAGRYRFLLTFWYAQALILLFYSMSGFWKVAAAVQALAMGEFSALHPEALAQITAWKMLQTGQTSLLGPWLTAHPWLGWPAFLWVIYVELVAIVILFRPSLHRLWGLMLIAFHIGTFFLLNISFGKHLLALTILLVWSPFIQGPVGLGATLAALPGLEWLRRRGRRALAEPAPGRAMLAYDGDCPFCSRYVAMLRLRRDYGLELVNARERHPFIDEVRATGRRLDQGMVLKLHDRFYHGERALNMLALMSEERGPFSLLTRTMFKKRLLARLLYPLLAAGRRLTLWILMRPKLEY